MDGNGAQESHIDIYAQFNSLKAQTKNFLKSNHRFSLAVQSPASPITQIAKLGWLGKQDSVQTRKTDGQISKISFSMV